MFLFVRMCVCVCMLKLVYMYLYIYVRVSIRDGQLTGFVYFNCDIIIFGSSQYYIVFAIINNREKQ